MTTSGPPRDHLPSPLSKDGSRRATKKAERKASEALSAQAESEWSLFADLPGKHLLYQKTGWNSWEWINRGTRGIEMTSTYNGFGPKPKTISYQGGTYGWQRVGRRRVLVENRVRDLVNLTTRSPLLRRSGRHFNGVGSTEIALGPAVSDVWTEIAVSSPAFFARTSSVRIPSSSWISGSRNREASQRMM